MWTHKQLAHRSIPGWQSCCTVEGVHQPWITHVNQSSCFKSISSPFENQICTTCAPFIYSPDKYILKLQIMLFKQDLSIYSYTQICTKTKLVFFSPYLYVWKKTVQPWHALPGSSTICKSHITNNTTNVFFHHFKTQFHVQLFALPAT